MLSCRFNRYTSLWANGRDFWLAGVTQRDRNTFTSIYRVPGEHPIIGVEGVDEGVVHLLTADRSVYIFGAEIDPLGGIVQLIGRLP